MCMRVCRIFINNTCTCNNIDTAGICYELEVMLVSSNISFRHTLQVICSDILAINILAPKVIVYDNGMM